MYGKSILSLDSTFNKLLLFYSLEIISTYHKDLFNEEKLKVSDARENLGKMKL